MRPRKLAIEVLLAVFVKRQSLAAALPQAKRQLKQAQQARLQAMCYQLLREHHYLEQLANSLLKHKLRRKDCDILLILELSLLEIKGDITPAHAVVDNANKLAQWRNKNWAKGLVNAVLRNALRQKIVHKAAVGDVAKYSHPQWLIELIKSDWQQFGSAIIKANNIKAPLSLRCRQNAQQFLAQYNHHPAFKNAIIPSENLNAIVLDSAVDVEALPGFEQGQLSVQDVGAQWAAKLLDPQRGETILDACAAPGGKTGHILELAKVNLTAIDISADRLLLVNDNLQRLKLEATTVCADIGAYKTWWNGSLFDKILLDVPCSATGVIRRNPDIKILRQQSDLPQLAKLQQQYLQACWQMLARGGVLLYATCSVAKIENQRQIKSFLATAHDATLLPTPIEHAIDTGYGQQLLPGNALLSDGFFYALLQKN